MKKHVMGRGRGIARCVFLAGSVGLASVAGAQTDATAAASPAESTPAFDPTFGAAPQGAEAPAGNAGVYFYDLDQALMKISVASKTEQSLEEAPSSVTVFTREEIQNMGITSLEDLLNFVPGYQVTRDVEQGIDWRIASRGRGSAVSESVLVLIDGQRINDLYTGGASIVNHMIEVGNIKKVEIIRGPGSALYGSNAFLGVISIETVEKKNEAALAGGSNFSRRGEANLSTHVGEVQLSAFVSGFADDGQGYRSVTQDFGKTGPTSDPRSGLDFYSTVRWKGLTLRIRHMDREDQDFLIFSSLANDTQYVSTRQTSGQLEYESDLSHAVHLDVGASVSLDHWKGLLEAIQPGVEVAPGFVTPQAYYGGPFLEGYYASGHADLRWDVMKGFTVSAGLQYDNTNFTRIATLGNFDELTLEPFPEITEVTDPNSVFNIKKTRQIVGAYLQGQNDFHHLHLTYGLRLDHYNDFGSSLNPRAAITYDTPVNSWIKVMYGQAFRAPNYLELYDRANPIDFGNPNLDAETVRTLEVAYIQKLGFLEASGTFFHNTFSNLIQYGAPGDPAADPLGAPQFVNAQGNPVTRGFEFELRTQARHGVSAYASYTHFIDKDIPVSPDAAAVALNYTFQKLNLNVNGIYRSAIQGFDQDAYALANVAARYTMVKDLDLELSVQNVFNTRFRTVSKFLPEGVPNRGRSFLVGLRTRF